jgi:hypothetical protein
MAEGQETQTQTPPQAQGQTPNGTPNGKSPIEETRKRLLQVESILNQYVIGHEQMIRAMMVAVVAGEHMVIILAKY